MAADKQIHKLIYMANQIGKFFAGQRSQTVAAGIADHIAKFWDPRMRAKIIAHAGQGGEGLDPLVRDAVAMLASAAPVAPVHVAGLPKDDAVSAPI